jgi:hypothetical protein
VGDRPQPRPLPARQDQALQRAAISRCLQLAVIPRGARRGPRTRGPPAWPPACASPRRPRGQVAAAVALAELGPDAHDELDVAVQDALGLDHHAAQLAVLRAGLDLQRAAGIALEVADLLGGRVCPSPQRGLRCAARTTEA